MMSRNPPVMTRPVRAPFRSMIVLVTSVVACMKYAISESSLPRFFKSRSVPSRIAILGSAGVVRSLPVEISPLVASCITRSVKVPPTSAASLNSFFAKGRTFEIRSPLGAASNHQGDCGPRRTVHLCCARLYHTACRIHRAARLAAGQ